MSKKQQLLVQSNLKISLGVIMSSRKSGPFTSVCLLVKQYDNNIKATKKRKSQIIPSSVHDRYK